jgi:hypothetical protein
VPWRLYSERVGGKPFVNSRGSPDWVLTDNGSNIETGYGNINECNIKRETATIMSLRKEVLIVDLMSEYPFHIYSNNLFLQA